VRNRLHVCDALRRVLRCRLHTPQCITHVVFSSQSFTRLPRHRIRERARTRRGEAATGRAERPEPTASSDGWERIEPSAHYDVPQHECHGSGACEGGTGTHLVRIGSEEHGTATLPKAMMPYMTSVRNSSRSMEEVAAED
jgi:hypothetical protein